MLLINWITAIQNTDNKIISNNIDVNIFFTIAIASTSSKLIFKKPKKEWLTYVGLHLGITNLTITDVVLHVI